MINLTLLGATSILLLVSSCAAQRKASSAGPAMTATINPVDTSQDRVASKINYGTVRFTPGNGKVNVLVQAAGVPLGGREPEIAADGEPASVGFNVRIVKTADCATADQNPIVLAELPQLRVISDGSGVLMASTDKVTMEQIAGQAVLISSPRNNTRVGCGVIKAE